MAGGDLRTKRGSATLNKGNKPQDILLTPALETHLPSLEKDIGPIPANRSDLRYTKARMRNVLETALAKTKVKLRRYDARHTFISWLAEAGVPLAEIRAIAGHIEIRTTMRYIHLSPDYLERARQALGGARLQVVR